MSAKVTFVVPCYKLAHYLNGCIRSILGQTHQDLEIIIMDDCSPDNTGEVAAAIDDPRVLYFKNAKNMGHLRNYNEGIRKAQGKYVWVLSPDDSLRTPDTLERFVRIMEEHPEVGYVFCPVMDFDEKSERIGRHSVHGEKDTIFPGHEIVRRLMHSKCVPGPSGLARKDCFDRLSLFPLDLPFTGDEYLWALYALYYDVGYIADPLVNYRIHESSMTSTLRDKDCTILAWNTMEVIWRIKRICEKENFEPLVQVCRRELVRNYVENILPTEYRGTKFSLPLQVFEQWLLEATSVVAEQKWIRARVYAGLADAAYWKGQFAEAVKFYKQAVEEDSAMPQVRIKYALIRMGRLGFHLRESIFAVRRTAARLYSH